MPTITVEAAGETTSVAYTAPDAQPTRTVFGANCGGYSGETAQHAFTRIAGHWQLGMVRWWANNITARTPPSYFGGLPVAVEWDADPAQFANGAFDEQVKAAFATYRGGDCIDLNHEFDNAVHKGASLSAHVDAQQHFSDLAKQYRPDGVDTALVLMGGAYIPGRGVDGHTWQDYWPDDPSGFTLLGADSYQHGTTDSNADSAHTILDGVFAAAATLNKDIGLFEFGARSGGTAVTDAGRAKFLTDSTTLIRANGRVRLALAYESYRGSLGPWNLLETSATSAVFSPQAAAVWANACAA